MSPLPGDQEPNLFSQDELENSEIYDIRPDHMGGKTSYVLLSEKRMSSAPISLNYSGVRFSRRTCEKWYFRSSLTRGLHANHGLSHPAQNKLHWLEINPLIIIQNNHGIKKPP